MATKRSITTDTEDTPSTLGADAPLTPDSPVPAADTAAGQTPQPPAPQPMVKVKILINKTEYAGFEFAKDTRVTMPLDKAEALRLLNKVEIVGV